MILYVNILSEMFSRESWPKAQPFISMEHLDEREGDARAIKTYVAPQTYRI